MVESRGFVWFDAYSSGNQEGGESGIADILAILYDEENNFVGVTETDLNGEFVNEDLNPNTYYLV